MAKDRKLGSISRRGFLATTGSLITVAPAVGRSLASTAGETPLPRPASAPAPMPTHKIPIGVFDSAYSAWADDVAISTDEMIDKVAALGLEAIEIGSGGQNHTNHCPMAELLADPAKAKAWQKKFTDRNITIRALAMHGNPVHPDTTIAAKHDKGFRDSVLLAERLEIPVLVGFSGCPGAGPDDKNTNWIINGLRPQLEWQWNEKVIPYWKVAAKFARDHGVRKIALETHPNTVTYNARRVLKLREAAGEEIGANIDMSWQFFEGVDPVEVIHYLGKQGAIYHAHMRDQTFVRDFVAKNGRLDFSPVRELRKGGESSYHFCTIGYGHSEQTWKDIVKAYMDVGFPGMMSIEIEDPFLSSQESVARGAALLQRVRASLLAQPANAACIERYSGGVRSQWVRLAIARAESRGSNAPLVSSQYGMNAGK